MRASAATLLATRLGPAFDLLAAYRTGGVAMVKDGWGVAGYGVASGWETGASQDGSRQDSNMVREHLDGLDIPEGAPAPIAFGSIRFEPGLTSTWIVPSKMVRRDPGEDPWLLELVDPDQVLGSFEATRVVEGSPSDNEETELDNVPSPDRYRHAVAEAVERIRTGHLKKVVLARAIDVKTNRPLDAKRLLVRLRAIEPSCYAFATPLGPDVQLVGASPELLISRFGREIAANPLAGSAGRSGDPAEDTAAAERLLASAKDREEHAIVVEGIAETLKPYCEDLRFDDEPALEETANVWHLSTSFRGRLRDPSVSVLDLVSALHPTAAVCGEPRDAALAAIHDLEGLERGAYAGPVGWVDSRGDGVWALALRCAEISPARARLFAGAGIVAGSKPEAELEETERKFRAFLDPLRWG